MTSCLRIELGGPPEGRSCDAVRRVTAADDAGGRFGSVFFRMVRMWRLVNV